MLLSQACLCFSDYSSLYDLNVPQDNLLRRIYTVIDFFFVYTELASKYCPDNGRTAESPIRMFKYLLLKAIYNLSDVDLVERSCYDMSFKYFLGMVSEDDVIKPQFAMQVRLKDIDLLNLLINKTVTLAIEQGVIKSTFIIVDVLHANARSNGYFRSKSEKNNQIAVKFNCILPKTEDSKPN